ncbi:hypothetical protein GOV07_01145 [Candidatus Woesearchaeota archaeon]|nr:hypothetical protein [Candidatus Woesearchaeota archaeon]
MDIFKWANKKAKNFNKWYDFSIFKVTMIAFALWLAIVWPTVLKVNPWIYFVIFVVGWIYLWWKMFK